MAWTSSLYSFFSLFLLLCASLSGWGLRTCEGLGKLGFDIHHRFSDPVKAVLPVDGLPKKDSVEYYSAMAHRDRILRGRSLASTTDQAPLTFYYGNETFLASALGFLHYANVSVGTPQRSYLVALDSGSDLFWLPCDCTTTCVPSLKTSSGEILFNIYSTSTSSSGSIVTCSSSLCQNQNQCISPSDACPYEVIYLSNGTSSSGFLVEDILLLTTDNAQQQTVDANITFGCGKAETGTFLEGSAPNGLMGLGMDDLSVPSTLAKQGLTSNSFSMCFGSDGIGRIEFGDKGSSGQSQTPFTVDQTHPTYNISITQITVGPTTTNLNFTAIFDTGTSFTYLTDPAYTAIAKTFDSKVQGTRHPTNASTLFEYCYVPDSNSQDIIVPKLNLTMKGGDQFYVTYTMVPVQISSNNYIFCLGLFQSSDVNLIGQNFMTGYNIVFDREKLVLGWKPSNCYDGVTSSNTLPVKPAASPSVPPASVNPQATSNGSSTTASGKSSSNRLNPVRYAFLIVFLSILIVS